LSAANGPLKKFDADGFRVFHSGMRKISFWFLMFTLAVGAARGQDAATQQQMDKLSGQIRDLTDTVEVQRKHIDALEKELGELRDKVNTPQVSDSASREDLKKLAVQVQEIDQKRADDRELILKNIEKISKVAAGGDAAPVRTHKPTPKPDDTTPPAPTTPQSGYEYVVKSGDTLGLIAKAYREQGVKVTSTQILKANPGLDATKLYVGKKIFIPYPNAK
jgi:LysM repeat protein